MTLTHGDRLLAHAEARAARAVRNRRMRAVGIPALLATLASVVSLYRAQHARVVATGASGFRHVGGHATMITFTFTFVVLPLVGAIRSRRAFPAVVAIVAGPVLTPRLFGAGGWRWWQTLVVVVASALVSASALVRRRAGRARAPQVAT